MDLIPGDYCQGISFFPAAFMHAWTRSNNLLCNCCKTYFDNDNARKMFEI